MAAIPEPPQDRQARAKARKLVAKRRRTRKAKLQRLAAHDHPVPGLEGDTPRDELGLAPINPYLHEGQGLYNQTGPLRAQPYELPPERLRRPRRRA